MKMTRVSGQSMMAVLLLVSSAVACAKKNDAEYAADSAAAPAMRPDSMTTTATLLSDAQIAQVALTASSADSANGELAKTKATAADVKAFAQTMIKDHGELNRQAVALAGKLNLTPATSETADALKRDADSGLTNLSAKSGAEFDRAYMDAEVAMHQKVLDALDQTLIPQAVNADLKSLLQSARGVVEGHLTRAKSLQSKTAM